MIMDHLSNHLILAGKEILCSKNLKWLECWMCKKGQVNRFWLRPQDNLTERLKHNLQPQTQHQTFKVFWINLLKEIKVLNVPCSKTTQVMDNCMRSASTSKIWIGGWVFLSSLMKKDIHQEWLKGEIH